MTGGDDKTAQITIGGAKEEKGAGPDPPVHTEGGRAGAPGTVPHAAPQDKTRAVSRAKGARLVCTGGLVKGEEFPLGEGTFIAGRKDGLQLTLDDGMVSRRHAEISCEDGAYVLRDLGSRNGTKVNGRRVKEKNLRHGDRIKIGRTEFRFFLGAEGASAGLTNGRFFQIVWGVLVERPLIPVLIVLIGVLSIFTFLPQSPRETAGTGEKAPLTGPGTSLQQAREALESGNFSLSREMLYQILAARPDDTEAQALVKKAGEEEQNLQTMKESEALTSQGKTQEAIEALKRISAGSVLHEKARESIASLRHSLTEPLLKEAKEFLKQKQWTQARERLEDVLEKDPDNTLAVELLDLLISWEVPETPPQKKKGDSPIRGQSSISPGGGQSPPPPAGPRAETNNALVLYMEGDLEGAISSWQKEAGENGDRGAREKFVLATSVRKYLALAEGEGRRGQRAPAIQALTKAMSFHEKIAGGTQGPMGEKISSSLAEALARKGEESMAGGRFEDAFLSFRKAMEVQPDNRRSLEGIQRLGQKAEEVYRQAYVLEKVNSEEALEKYKQILSMVPPENEYYVKAREKAAAYRK